MDIPARAARGIFGDAIRFVYKTWRRCILLHATVVPTKVLRLRGAARGGGDECDCGKGGKRVAELAWHGNSPFLSIAILAHRRLRGGPTPGTSGWAWSAAVVGGADECSDWEAAGFRK